MNREEKGKQKYTTIVSICAGILFFGSLLLFYLMATRDMAPPRKYSVDMSGTVIGVDTTHKLPVLTKDEAKQVEIKERKKIDYVKEPKENNEPANTETDPIIVPSIPPSKESEVDDNNKKVDDQPEIKVPKVELTEKPH